MADTETEAVVDQPEVSAEDAIKNKINGRDGRI